MGYVCAMFALGRSSPRCQEGLEVAERKAMCGILWGMQLQIARRLIMVG